MRSPAREYDSVNKVSAAQVLLVAALWCCDGLHNSSKLSIKKTVRFSVNIYHLYTVGSYCAMQRVLITMQRTLVRIQAFRSVACAVNSSMHTFVLTIHCAPLSHTRA
jgi:hypothetical protein